MKKYELIRERFTACSGDRHPQNHPWRSLPSRTRRPMCRTCFTWKSTLRIDQRQAGASLVFDVYTGSIHQRFTFTEL